MKGKTLKQIIKEKEQSNKNIGLVVVVGSLAPSILRQLNNKALERFGETNGYTANKIKDIDAKTSLWELNKS